MIKDGETQDKDGKAEAKDGETEGKKEREEATKSTFICIMTEAREVYSALSFNCSGLIQKSVFTFIK